MSLPVLLVAGLFLPLFPFSMLFNVLYARVRHPVLRGVLLLVWPQIGLAIILMSSASIPPWLPVWALLTSLLYALRALALRELGLWTSFIATSAWALVWIVLSSGASMTQLQWVGLGISAPLLLMAFLVAGLEHRFGAAYLDLYGGLAQTIPRYTTVLVIVILAIIASPLFPTFFAMLSIIIKVFPVRPSMAIGVGVVWLLWSWAGARVLQGLIIGPGHRDVVDLKQASLWLYLLLLAGLIVSGVYGLGGML